MRGTLFRSNNMLMARYLLLLLVFHIASFFQLLPWTFVWGLVSWPWCFVQGMLVEDEHKKIFVATNAKQLMERSGIDVPSIPDCIRRWLERIHQEAAAP